MVSRRDSDPKGLSVESRGFVIVSERGVVLGRMMKLEVYIVLLHNDD